MKKNNLIIFIMAMAFFTCGLAPAPPANINYPAYPWWTNSGIDVDKTKIDAQAGLWCTAPDVENKDVADFFFRWMPLETTAGLCDKDLTNEQIREMLGRMYLSGWYGGLWFRDNSKMDMGGHGTPEPVKKEDFMKMADKIAGLIKISTQDTASEVFDHNHVALIGEKNADFMTKMMGALFVLYAYNDGYVKAIIDKPPKGVDASKVKYPCEEYMKCDLSDPPLNVYEDYLKAMDQIDKTPNDRWKTLAKEMEDNKKWEDVAKKLWKSSSITAEAWPILVAINKAYLQITDVAALGSMLGYGDKNEEAGRCATLLEAAVDTWNQAYFMAITSDAPKGTMPTLICPPGQ